MADSFEEARKNIYKAIEKIKFEGKQFRTDIALSVEEENL
ncbi:MAG: hypothetical protein U5N58_14535 [Actinomycetota bacterium]|nr:hypothetical protein [Actinomycetota bacterium]